MAARSIWKGYLRLSLVNCAVALYPAVTQATKIHFHKLNRKTGNRLRMRIRNKPRPHNPNPYGHVASAPRIRSVSSATSASPPRGASGHSSIRGHQYFRGVPG